MPLERHQLAVGEVSFSSAIFSFGRFISWASSFWIGSTVITNDFLFHV